MPGRNTDVFHDTENKQFWVEHGARLEAAFIEKIAPQLSVDIRINPQKGADKYAPDFVDADGLADLKTQNTPFFTAMRHRKNPERTVTFNEKDLLRYEERYPGLTIYFYVRWDQTKYREHTVEFVHGVWRTDVGHIRRLIDAGCAPKHEYQRRRDDSQGNAKSSYLISLDDLEMLLDLHGKQG